MANPACMLIWECLCVVRLVYIIYIPTLNIVAWCMKKNKKGEFLASNLFGKDEWAPFAGAMAGMWMDDVEMEQLIGFRLLNKWLPTSNGLCNIETIWNKYFLRFCVGAACLHTHGSSSGAVGKCAEWFIPKSRSFSSPSFSSPASALHLSFGIYHHYLNQLITMDITYVVSGMSHQVSNRHYSWLSLWFDAWSDDMPFVAAQKNPGPSTSPCRQGVEWRWSTTKMGSSNVVPSSYLGRPGREHNGRVGLWVDIGHGDNHDIDFGQPKSPFSFWISSFSWLDSIRYDIGLLVKMHQNGSKWKHNTPTADVRPKERVIA